MLSSVLIPPLVLMIHLVLPLLHEEQPQTRNTSGLKLKDYLNNRTENISAIPSQYYNVHKGVSGQMQMDLHSTTKSYLTDGVNVQSQVASSMPAQSQQYHSAMYTDTRPPSHYHYKSRTSNENQTINPSTSIANNYVAPKRDDSTRMYHPIAQGGLTADVTTNIAPYVTGYLPTDQTYTAALSDAQNKLIQNSMVHYNQSGTLQYNALPTSMEHSNSIQDPTLLNHYGSTQDKTGIMNENAMISQMQSMSLTHVPPISAGALDPNAQVIQNVAQIPAEQHQYAPKNKQTTVLGADSGQYSSNVPSTMQSQNILSSQNNPVVQNYPYSHVNQSNVSPYVGQPYQNTAFANQQPSIPAHSASGTEYMTSMSYLQGQQNLNTSVQSAQSATSIAGPVAAATIPAGANEIPASYSDMQAPTVVPQYTQASYTNQQMQINSTMNYPSSYQNFYQPSSALSSYPQNQIMTTGVTTNYPYTNYTSSSSPSSSELIQSHAKANSISSYSQPYDYSHQRHYSEYAQNTNYSHLYGYPYLQGTHGMNPASVSYEPQSISGAFQTQESSARYTNASNNAMVSQTPSSQYSNQVYQPQVPNEMYYSTPYGLQMQGQGGTTTKQDNNYNQTYMQAVDNGTNTTTSSDPIKLTTKSDEAKSNVDLLSDLDVTINHAPLVPEIRPLNKTQSDQNGNLSMKDADAEKEGKKEDSKVETVEKPSTSTDTKEEMENLQIVWDTWYTDVQPKKDPLGNPETLQKFVNEVEKYEKFVDSLLVKTLSGATNLDNKWKEVQDFEERESAKQSCTVALAHSSDNRITDCIPYDATRMQISTSDASSTYINASHVVEITQWTPTAFIITQAPMSNKVDMFWTMIWEQECEVIACLASDAQLKQELYWPTDKDNDFSAGNFVISLSKTVTHNFYIQRVLLLRNTKTKSERNVVHMQFLVWPSNSFPNSPGALLAFATDVMTEQALRRCSPKPIVVHCISGGPLSGLFLVAASTVCHIRAGRGIADVPLIFKGLIKCRKQVVNKESLLFAYRMVLYHAQDILMKRGILSSTRSTFEGFESLKLNKEKSIRKTHPSDDFLHNLNVGAQHSQTKQGADSQTASTSNNNTTSADKVKDTFVDPLSQLDPLWSIRR